MNKLEEIAKEEVGGGEIYKPVDAIIAEYPEGVTVNGCRALSLKDGSIVPGLTFEEDSTAVFPAASGDLRKIFERWVDYCGGDESKVNQLLKETPVKLKVSKVPQKKRPQPYVKVVVVSR